MSPENAVINLTNYLKYVCCDANDEWNHREKFSTIIFYPTTLSVHSQWKVKHNILKDKVIFPIKPTSCLWKILPTISGHCIKDQLNSIKHRLLGSDKHETKTVKNLTQLMSKMFWQT